MGGLKMRAWLKGKARLIGGFAAAAIFGVIVFFVLIMDNLSLTTFFLTPDQQGSFLFQKERYVQSAETFRDPLWQATAWYRAGEFKKAAGIFTGFDTAEGAFNHGNALTMQGEYAEAIPRYERALALKPEWKDARVNLAIARQGLPKSSNGARITDMSPEIRLRMALTELGTTFIK